MFLLLTFMPVFSQTSRSEDARNALEVPVKLFAAMREKNFEAIRALFTADGQLVALDKPRDGKGLSKTRVFSGEQFARMISEAKAPEFVERMPQPEAKLFGDLATVYGRYTFYVGDKFSHCGTNTFNLVRTEAGWLISNGASTLEFQCERDLKTVEIPVVAADPRDVSTIDGIMRAFYEVISGPPGQARQWSRDRTLYAPEARMAALSEENGKIRAVQVSQNQFANGSNEFFVTEGFVERELRREVRRFGNIAHVFSAYEYETTREAAKKEKGRGVNSLQLFWDGTRWWIFSVSWDEERPGNPIPKQFKPNVK